MVKRSEATEYAYSFYLTELGSMMQNRAVDLAQAVACETRTESSLIVESACGNEKIQATAVGYENKSLAENKKQNQQGSVGQPVRLRALLSNKDFTSFLTYCKPKPLQEYQDKATYHWPHRLYDSKVLVRRPKGTREEANGHITRALAYMLMFALQKRHGSATVNPWPAEAVPNLFRSWYADGACAKEAQSIVDEAKKHVAKYIKASSCTPGMETKLARHAVLLAKLDWARWYGHVDPDLMKVDEPVTKDLVRMKRQFAYKELGQGAPLILGPTFGSDADSSGVIDIVSGDQLIIANTAVSVSDPPNTSGVDWWYGRLMLGYILAEEYRKQNPDFPEIRRLGIYFARHGKMLTVATEPWASSWQYSKTRDWALRTISPKRSAAIPVKLPSVREDPVEPAYVEEDSRDRTIAELTARIGEKDQEIAKLKAGLQGKSETGFSMAAPLLV
jgi:hypothetical protein